MNERLSNIDREKLLLSEEDRIASSISVVIVSYNSRELLRDCLVSIESEPWQQVTVVDNLSSDESDKMVSRDFPWVNLTTTEKNDGYAAAANLGIVGCTSKYVLLLNSDTVLQPGVLQTLSDYLDRHPQVAVVGPQLVNSDGSHQNSYFEFPTPLHTLIRETNLSLFVQGSSKLTSAEALDRSDYPAWIVSWVLGAALAIRRTAFDAVGGFDESYFMYFEEVDLCYRLKQAGWQTHFVPKTLVMHVGGASTKSHRAAMLQRLYKSLCHFYQKHYSGGQKLQLRMILTYLMLRNIVRDSFKSYRANRKNDMAENVLIWRSVLSSIWSANGWLRV